MATGYHAETQRKARARREKMKALLKSGIKLTDVAKRNGISPARVHQIVYPNGRRK